MPRPLHEYPHGHPSSHVFSNSSLYILQQESPEIIDLLKVRLKEILGSTYLRISQTMLLLRAIVHTQIHMILG